MNSIDKFWINCFFNCNQDEYFSDKDIVCQHFFLGGYNGFFVLNVRNKFIISAPKEYIDLLKIELNGNVDFYNRKVWEALLNNHFDSFVGPAWIGYYNEAAFYKVDSPCRELNLSSEEDKKSLYDLKGQCDITEWRHSSIDSDSKVIIAQFLDNKIVSAASYKLWGEMIAQVGI